MNAIAFLRRTPSAVLLGVQLLGVILYPLMESSPRGRALFGIFGIVVVGIALWVVRRGPWLTWLGVALALPVVLLSVRMIVASSPELSIATAALERDCSPGPSATAPPLAVRSWHAAGRSCSTAASPFSPVWG